MNKNSKIRLTCLLLTVTLLMSVFAPALAAGVDYTMAYKLFRQLASGSGFSGTLEVILSANENAPGEATVTAKPFVIDWDYIYVRPTAAQAAQHRLDAELLDGEATVTELHAQLMDGVLSAQSPLLGDAWYALKPESLLKAGSAEDGGSLSAQWQPQVEDVLNASGMPAVIRLAAPLLFQLHGFTDEAQRERLQAVVEKMSLRMDLWIEGYRQNAELGRLEDGSAIITVSYLVPTANIKTQAMQMVLDLLSDEAARQSLADFVDEQTAALLLNPEYQPYYFAAIEALPLSGDLTLSRTMDMRGDTVALHLSLPFYDAEGGPITLEYDRERGEGDLPDTNTLTMEGGNRTAELSYLTYRSMTDVTVYQGTFVMTDRSADSFAVTPEGQEKPLPDVAFTLRRQTAQTREEGDWNVYTDNWQLQLEPNPNGAAPDAFPPLNVEMNSRFGSKTPQTAATQVDIDVTVSGEERPQVTTLQFSGATRRQWQPEELPRERTDMLSLTGEELEGLLANLVLEGAQVLAFFEQTTVEPMPASGEAAGEEMPEAANPETVPQENTEE